MSAREPIKVEGLGGIKLERGVGFAGDEPDEVEQPAAVKPEGADVVEETATAPAPEADEEATTTQPKKARKPRAAAAPAPAAAVIPGPATATAPALAAVPEIPAIPALPANAGREIPPLLYGAATGAIGKFMAAERARTDAWKTLVEMTGDLRADPRVTEDAIWRLFARYGAPIPPAPDMAQPPAAAEG